jgi:hypothetical protein
MRQRLAQNAHVEPLTAARTLHEVIGLGLRDAVRIPAGLRHLTPHIQKLRPPDLGFV